MLHNSVIRVLALCLFCLTVSTAYAQDEERVPSGDLSNFFNPPGVKESEGVSSTTRSIGKGKLTSDSKTNAVDKPAPKSTTDSTSKTDKEEDKAVETKMAGAGDKSAPDAKSTSDSDANPPPVDNASGRVQLEKDEVTGPLEGGVTFGRATKTNWRVGVGLLAGTKAVQNITCRIPVPAQWPEQTVSVFEEELPPEILSVDWEDLGNIRMLKLKIGDVPPGEKMVATVTFSVSTSQILPPPNKAIFRIPKKRTRDIKGYYGESPEINIRNTRIKKEAKRIFDSAQSDWVKVESLYNWVREEIEERAGDPKGSLDAFLNKSGHGEDRVSLFVAMCRINKVPARMVFVDGLQYAEFYLVDDKEQGHWFPCMVNGIREFGSISEPKVILQKGDNYRVPGEKKKLKFVPAKAVMKGSKPRKIMFVREPLSVK